jgi:transcriptional regulator with XRE-family HTH domain
MRTGTASLSRVDHENGRPQDLDELPGVHKTVNQVIAWNIAYYRKAAGITQAELGERTGRAKRNISADERSWDGERTREFNAAELAALSAALGVPIGAFFLPPEDDGVTVRYLFRPHGKEPDCLGMGDLMAMVMPDSQDDSRAMDAYRRRLTAAVRQYMAPVWSDEVARWMAAMTEEEIDAEAADELRAEREVLLRIAARHGRIIKSYEPEEAGE